MLNNKRLPFQSLDEKAWQNLTMAGLVVIYVVQSIWSLLIVGPLTNSIGFDFRALWSSGYIANTYGFAEVYKLTMLTQVQKLIVPLTTFRNNFEVVPAPFLPIFMPIFQVFSLIPPVPSFYVWSIFNLIGFFFYIRFFLKKLEVQNWRRLSILGLLAFPSFSNLFWGQVNLLLLVCVGEFIRNNLDKREFRAGLWLGGLILKPQLLILIGPVMLLQRKWKLLGGFSSTIVVTLISSLLLGKLSSLVNLATLLTKYVPGIASNAQENMTNWRMVGERLSIFLPITISWGIAAIGIAGTTLVTYLLWRKPLSSSSPTFLLAFTGTLAATMAVTWHSHIHMAMVLIPPILYLYDRQVFPRKLFNWWMLGVPFIVLFLTLPVKLLNLDRYNTLAGLTGFCMLIFNLIILVWAWRFNNYRTPSLINVSDQDSKSEPKNRSLL
jgi:hypothetical protein